MKTKARQAAKKSPTVGQHMTPCPHTIQPNRSLTAATKVMRENQIRHLPVIERGRVIGVISQRDVLIMETLPGVNPTDVRVEEAMVSEVYTVEPETPLAEAIDTMIERRVGSAIVCEGDDVVGVFTTVDALGALRQLLRRI
jgi:acetoin utilization protein AcuB